MLRSRDAPDAAYEVFCRTPGVPPTDLRVRVFPPDRLLIEVAFPTLCLSVYCTKPFRREKPSHELTVGVFLPIRVLIRVHASLVLAAG